jgi:hypothetical protein
MTLPVFTDPVTKQPSVSLTIVAITFTVVLGKWMLGGVTLFGRTMAGVSVPEIDAWLAAAFLLYFGRGATKAVENVQMAKVAATMPPVEGKL